MRVNEKTSCIFFRTRPDGHDQLTELYKSVAKNELAVAHIIVDNLEEIRQYEQDRFRECSSQNSVDPVPMGAGMRRHSQGIRTRQVSYDIHRGAADECIAKKVRHTRPREGYSCRRRRRPDHGVDGHIGIFREALPSVRQRRRTHLKRLFSAEGDQVVVRGETATESYGGPDENGTAPDRVLRASYIERASHVYVARIERDNNGSQVCRFRCVRRGVGVCRLAMFAEVPVNTVTDFGDPSLDECRGRVCFTA